MMIFAVILRSILWLTGFEPVSLSTAVERGTATVESRAIGEVSDDLIRKAIQTQRDTLPFWKTLAMLGDFLLEPLALALRAVSVAVAFSALAALTGRPNRFDEALADCSWAQIYWVIGLASRVSLTIWLRRPDVETSAALLLPAGHYHAAAVLLLRQIDVFALFGWISMALGARARGQSNSFVAFLICGLFFFIEAILRTVLGLIQGAGMRLSFLPG